MSRAVCAVTDDILVGMGPLCHLTALDAEKGSLRFKELVAEVTRDQQPLFA